VRVTYGAPQRRIAPEHRFAGAALGAAPVTGVEAPVAGAEAPVASAEAPVASAEAPATAAEAPMTAAGPTAAPGRFEAAEQPGGNGWGPTWRAAWPVVSLLALYPLWWALGLADYMPILLAFPMAKRMYGWRATGRRRLIVPPGFALWMLFLLCTAASLFTLSLRAPATIDSSVANRLVSFGDRSATYIAITILLLYVGNLTESELSRRRLAWLLGLMAVYAITGGIAAMALPGVQFTSPLWHLVPGPLHANLAVTMHPALANVQSIVGAAGGRPKAPFDFTNTWGNCLAQLLPWLLVGWWANGTRRQRFVAGTLLVISIAPIVYSLNRAMWIGLGLSVGYLAVRMAARGRLAPLGAMMAGVALIGVALVATPLSTVISQRLANGQSDQIRSNLTAKSFQDAAASPVLGYGDTRRVIGSVSSIAVGPTPNCPTCGQAVVGSNGQLWLLLICVGIPGTVFYIGFFAYGVWRYRRDRTPIGMAGVLVLLLTFLFMTAYVAVGTPLVLTMLAYALLWKNDQQAHGAKRRPLSLAVRDARRAVARPTQEAPR
jgi:hypothetical protein